MRRRLVISTIAIVLVVLGALALPVGIVIYDTADKQLEARLAERTDVIGGVVARSEATGDEIEPDVIRSLLGADDGVSITTSDGRILLSVPADPGASRTSMTRTPNDTVVRVHMSAEPLDDDFRRQLQVLLMLALGAIAAAAGLAAVQAHQLARPLERLSRRAGVIGDGDFSLGPFRRTRIPEIDAIGAALETSSNRVDTMLANERHFTADATHQLRTGIAGIAMRAEIMSMYSDAEVASEARELLAQTDTLNATIDELLAAARNRTSQERGAFDLLALVESHIDEWQPRYAAVRRHVNVIVATSARPVFGTKGLAGQVVDILIDNALRHGAGTVTLLIDGPSVTVIDQGSGVPPERVAELFHGPVDPSARHGRGLSLARRLAQVDGASLEVVGNAPLRIKFSLPPADTPLAR